MAGNSESRSEGTLDVVGPKEIEAWRVIYANRIHDIVPELRRAAFQQVVICDLALDGLKYRMGESLPSELGGWQPFDTAPKDGSHFLSYRPGYGVEEAWWKEDAGMNAVHWGGLGFWFVPDCLPTHWMPMPKEPK